MASYYTDNPDLRRRIGAVAWNEILPPLEGNFGGDDELAPSSVEEAREQIDMVLELVGKISADEIAQHAAEVDRVGARLIEGDVVYSDPTRKAFDLLAESGLMGLMLPREFGGMNFPATAYTAVVEMIARADAALMTVYALQGCGDTIHRFGTREMHEQYLPGLCSGEATAAMALTEPDAGSALDTVTTRAEEQPDGTWRVSGSKCFITNGGADVLLVLARTEERRGAGGLSMFVVTKGEGVEVAKLESKLGIHGSPTAVLNFDNAPGILIGGRGAGLFPVALSLMYNARLEVAAQAVGIAQAAQVQATRYASERRQRRRTIDSFAPVREMLFVNAAQLEGARGIIMYTAEVLDRVHGFKRTGGDPAEVERQDTLADLLTPLAKYYAAEIATKVTSRAIQVHGGYGYMSDYPVERYYRDARITSIYEGTSQIQISTMIGPLLQGGLQTLFEPLLETTPESEGCAGLLESLRTSYKELIGTVERVRGSGKLAWQGWARLFADATAETLAALIFLKDAATDPRSEALARYQTRSAARRARRVVDTVESNDCTAFEDDSFDNVVGTYRPAP
ncbi:MAG: acyl-CoA dehydrogenase family protein [Planctomycetota bacterium]